MVDIVVEEETNMAVVVEMVEALIQIMEVAMVVAIITMNLDLINIKDMEIMKIKNKKLEILEI